MDGWKKASSARDLACLDEPGSRKSREYYDPQIKGAKCLSPFLFCFVGQLNIPDEESKNPREASLSACFAASKENSTCPGR